MHFKKRTGIAWLTIGISVAAASVADAQVNGGFETGTFSGWTTTGDDQIQTSALGTGPEQGTYDALIATRTDGSVNAGVPPGVGVSKSVLQTALHLSSPGLSAVGNGTPVLGSAITQSLSLTAGQRVTFDWDFLTNQVFYDVPDGIYQPPDPANDDFSFATLIKGTSTGPITKLADVFYGYAPAANPAGFVTGFSETSANDPFFEETLFHTTTLTAPTTGTYLLGFGVVNATTNATANGGNSALLIDDVRVSAAVPEPSSCLALATLGLGFLRVRRPRKSAKTANGQQHPSAASRGLP
jgi:hypothetical protein